MLDIILSFFPPSICESGMQLLLSEFAWDGLVSIFEGSALGSNID